MKEVKIITSLFLPVIYFFSKIIFIYLKKINIINIIVYALLLISDFITFYTYEIITYASIYAHIYFLFKICEKITNLIDKKKSFNDKVTLSFKVNYKLIQAHYLILYKQPKYKKFVILFFIGFKIKILCNIILLKYIGYLYCFGILYAQLKLYLNIMEIWYILNDSLTFYLDFIDVNLTIRSAYTKYMRSAYIVFFMTFGELIVLLVNGLK